MSFFFFSMIYRVYLEERQPIPVFLLGESHGQRRMVGYGLGVTKNWTLLKELSSSSTGFTLQRHTYLSFKNNPK